MFCLPTDPYVWRIIEFESTAQRHLKDAGQFYHMAKCLRETWHDMQSDLMTRELKGIDASIRS